MGERLSWLAEQVGGLKAGYVIFLGSPAAALPARPGMLQLRGPQGSLLIAITEESGAVVVPGGTMVAMRY